MSLTTEAVTGPAASRALRERIRAAAADGEALCIRGGGTKDFYGNRPRGTLLDTREYRGVVAYEPTELVITARCGTPLAEIDAVLAEKGQWLAFEPPSFGHASAQACTIGGVVAAGLSGPGRAWYGAARDFVLGAALIDARGRALNFGGRVMKNVAGYDVSRLLCGSLGVLGLIAEVSLKVLPRPAATVSVAIPMSAADALDRLNAWAGRPLPVTASAWMDEVLFLRLAGAAAAVEAAFGRFVREHEARLIDPDQATALWQALRDHRLPFFDGVYGAADEEHKEDHADGPISIPLWRLSVPSTAPELALAGRELIEWGGALRWLRSDEPEERIRAAARAAGGHATRFGRTPIDAPNVFEALSAPLLRLHRRLKAEFDPQGIFNPGRLVPEL